MRLLTFDEDGEVHLTRKFFDGEVPPYAILSHTWGAEEDEVSFQDVVGKQVNRKSGGYGKIEFCAKTAKKDGIEHFWIDTCAIDKSSSAELSEAITSMFRWYKEAAKCYVFLSDVSIFAQTDGLRPGWAKEFQESRWFTRGW